MSALTPWHVLILTIVWVIPALICIHIGGRKNLRLAGWVAGIVAGWVGVLILALVPARKSEAPRA